MKACPTSGPIKNRSSQNEREAASSRHSFPSSADQLCKRKENLLESATGEVCLFAKLRDCPCADDFTLVQQHEPITHAFSIHQLMNGQHQSATLTYLLAQELHDV